MRFECRNKSVSARRIESQKFAVLCAAAIALMSLPGCGVLLTPSMLVSMGTSLIGGVANGAIMGGSVIGALRGDTPGEVARNEAAAARSTPSMPLKRGTVQPLVSSAPESSCPPPGAPPEGGPCS
jgi:hypothetical protein